MRIASDGHTHVISSGRAAVKNVTPRSDPFTPTPRIYRTQTKRQRPLWQAILGGFRESTASHERKRRATIGIMRPQEIEAAADAAQLVVETHRRLVEFVKVGHTLAAIDAFVARTLADLGTKSAFLGYSPGRYPAFPSHACLSLNEVVVHGTAGMTRTPLKAGDLLSIDIGVKYRGWIGDAAWTYVIGEIDDEQKRLCECGIESLRRGIETLQPGETLMKWAETVQDYVEKQCGLFCVQGLGGHGYGRKLHKAPYVSNTVPVYLSEWPDARYRLTPGTLLAVEPMVAIGTGQLAQEPRRWPISTADGSLSVHYEHDVLVTESGPRILTEGLDDLPLVIG